MGQPNYEPEDEACNCEGIEPEWEWDDEDEVYRCTGCNAEQQSDTMPTCKICGKDYQIYGDPETNICDDCVEVQEKVL